MVRGIDYRLPVTSIYTRATRTVVFGSSRLDLLLMRETSAVRMTGLPSWVPDFSVGEPEFFRSSGGNTSGDTEWSMHAVAEALDEALLPVNGFCVGKVAAITPPRGKQQKISEVYGHIFELARHLPVIYGHGSG